MKILHRKRILVNTDPQRRCYDGCHYKSEYQWTSWNILQEGILPERVESVLDYWRGLNAYAVAEGRETTEYKASE